MATQPSSHVLFDALKQAGLVDSVDDVVGFRIVGEVGAPLRLIVEHAHYVKKNDEERLTRVVTETITQFAPTALAALADLA